MITILGPAYPWRGGIAHHTNMLARVCRQENIETDVITFSRQYPAILYPGKDQKEIEGGSEFSDVHAQCMIDTINPITWWRTARYIVQTGSKTCVFKYWHFYFSPVFTFIAWYLRKHGVKTICIIDHIYSHESHIIDKLLTKIFFSQVSQMIIQSAIDYDLFKQEFSDIPAVMIPLPSYNQFGPKIDQLLAREKLGLPKNACILLFFGFIRPYKGLDILIRSVLQLKEFYPHIHLVIVGEPFGSFKEYQNFIDINNMCEYVTICLSYVPNSDIPLWFSCADFFMLPYLSAPNSGAMEIAKFYSLPIIASNIPAFSIHDGKNNVQCVDYNNILALKRALQNRVSPSGNQQSKNSWRNIVNIIGQI